MLFLFTVLPRAPRCVFEEDRCQSSFVELGKAIKILIFNVCYKINRLFSGEDGNICYCTECMKTIVRGVTIKFSTQI